MKTKLKICILIFFGILAVSSPFFKINDRFIPGRNYQSSDLIYKVNFYESNIQTSKISGKIHINDNDPSSNWTVAKDLGICTGNGTYSEPFIIQDLIIDGGGSGSCIFIENSDAFFEIKNCTVYNSTGYGRAGIRLLNTNNGILVNNNCSNSDVGIHLLYQSNNITISGNNMTGCSLSMDNNLEGLYSLSIDTTNFVNGKPVYFYINHTNLGPGDFTNAGQIILANCNDSFISNLNISSGSMGVVLFYCHNNTISGNNVNFNTGGIVLHECKGNRISGNSVNNNEQIGIGLSNCSFNIISSNNASNSSFQFGIFLQNSNNNTLSGNTAINNYFGIGLMTCSGNNISGNTANNNYYGIALGQCSGNNILGNIANNNSRGILLSDLCEENTIAGNTANNNSYGIEQRWQCDDSIIQGNSLNYNDIHGIYLWELCHENIIKGNNVSHNGEIGINIDFHCDNNTITENIINSNSFAGIVIDETYGNVIFLNYFNNSVNAVEIAPTSTWYYGENNRWDYEGKGNYWADYTGTDANANGIGDVPYAIAGTAGNQDNFPLMTYPFSVPDKDEIPIELIILISVIGGVAVISAATLLLIGRKRKIL